VVKGTRTAVWLIMRQLRAGDTPEKIVEALPQLTAAGVYDAISYYHDHKSELDLIISEYDRRETEQDEIDIEA
jgi:uncharacterized protein (DUF433 family)